MSDIPTAVRPATTSKPFRPSRMRSVELQKYGLGALLFFLLVVTLQYRNGAYEKGFGAYPDEPAHYVTGLMVYKYVTTAFGTDPMAFGERFYAHYPAVAFGHWPPLFYLI